MFSMLIVILSLVNCTCCISIKLSSLLSLTLDTDAFYKNSSHSLPATVAVYIDNGAL